MQFELQDWVSNVMNITTSFINTTITNGANWFNNNKKEADVWVNGKTNVIRTSIQTGWQNVIEHFQVLLWWSKFGFVFGAIIVVIFGVIYLNWYLGCPLTYFRRRRR